MTAFDTFRTRPRRRRWCVPALVLAAMTLAAACSDYGTGPRLVTGTYTATRFDLTVNGATTDLLASGAILVLTLAPDGTISGTLRASAVDPAANLSGTWTRTADIITISSQPVDTFLDYIPLQVSSGQLSGEGQVGLGTFRVTLRQQSQGPGGY